MRDVIKINVKRQQSSKRRHRRTRHQAAYILLVVLLVAGVGLSLSMTLFFNVTTVSVRNETDYDDAEIVALSGIQSGENLMRLDTGAAEKKIADALVYAESVSVDRCFPNRVEITITKSVPIANVTYNFGYLLVSASGKILETVEEPRPELLVIDGYDPATDVPGAYLASKAPERDAVLATMTHAVSTNPDVDIRSLDISDIYEITVQYGDRIVFEMGNSNDAEYKLRFAAKTAAELNSSKSYHMTMVGNNQISVISDDSAGIVHAPQPETTAETTTTTP